MKCTQCGSNDLINTMNLPFHVSGDAKLEVSKTDIFICRECGHLEFFNTHYIEKLKEQERQHKAYIEEIMQIKSELNKLDAIPFDEVYYQNKIAELKEEIKTLERLGVDGKSIRSREDSIKEYEKIIEDRKDPRTESQKNGLKSRLAELDRNHRRIY